VVFVFFLEFFLHIPKILRNFAAGNKILVKIWNNR